MATPTSLPASFTAGQVLTAAQMNNLRGAFRVLQVVTAQSQTDTTNATSTFADTTLTATITPTASDSKVLVMFDQNAGKLAGNSDSACIIRLMRGATDLGEYGIGPYTSTSLDLLGITISGMYLDSPATTSATTYKTQFKNNVNASGVRVQFNTRRSSIVLLEISA